MEHTAISQLYKDMKALDDVTVRGWVRNIRDSKVIGFIELHDGSGFKSLQVVFEQSALANFAQIAKLNVGAALTCKGSIVLTPQSKQPLEMHAREIVIEGASGPDYPLQKKRHSLEFLRTIAHLRPRTNTFNAVFRVRSCAALAIHRFFEEQGFVYVHTPIITGSDAEGAGQMFRVTTLDPKDPPLTESGEVDYAQDFFGKETNLTVSGQLEGECLAMAFSKIYTFGPTFRAENSNTPRHAAEFWMIEPEMAFTDLAGNMEVAAAMVQYVIGYVLDRCPDDIAFFNNFYDKGLLERLIALRDATFAHVTYTEAVKLLEKNNDNFEFKVHWGSDLQTEHERYLTENVFHGPVFVTDYPKEIKSFYMKQNADGKTVAAMDMLVPGVGELIGGSEREADYDKLVARIDELGLHREDYEWYLDLRRYGTVTHAGYGLGFDRLIMYLTGISNIRDVQIFPRVTGWAEF